MKGSWKTSPGTNVQNVIVLASFILFTHENNFLGDKTKYVFWIDSQHSKNNLLCSP